MAGSRAAVCGRSAGRRALEPLTATVAVRPLLRLSRIGLANFFVYIKKQIKTKFVKRRIAVIEIFADQS